MTPSAAAPPAHPFRVLDPADADRAVGPFDLVLERTAFGGGTHPTTASCLAVLAALAPLDGLRLLDLGSGSGILAIAAARLGAAGALCADVNPEAVAGARRNAERNGVGDRLEHLLGGADALGGRRFDLVAANIGGELLLDQAAAVAPLAVAGGRLLLSGMLAAWGDDLEAAYRALGCARIGRWEAGGFCTLLLAAAG